MLNMCAMYQPVSFGSTKPKRQKDKPVPLLFPVSLYSAIRTSCIYLTLDNNQDNGLNRSSDPILKQYNVGNGVISLFCYTADLLKMWLRFLTLQSLWSRTVTVNKQVKSKSGYSAYTSSATNDVHCLHIPTHNEIQQAAATCGMSVDEALFCAQQLSALLINIGPSNAKLLLPSEVPPHTIPLSTQVTTPNNITKQSRLLDIGYAKHALNSSEASSWDDFYTMEMARFKYIIAQATNTRITDASIKSLTDTNRTAYNEYAVSNYIDTMTHYKVPIATSTSAPIGKISQGNAVNPAILAFQHIAATAKNNKTTVGPSNNKKYSDMIEHYHRLTRFKLDIKSEKVAKTYSFRKGDIDWMESLIAKYPFIQFVHNVANNRPEVVASSVQHLFAAQPQTQSVIRDQSASTQSVQVPLSQSPPYARGSPSDSTITYGRSSQQNQSYPFRPSVSVPVNPLGSYHQPPALSQQQLQIPNLSNVPVIHTLRTNAPSSQQMPTSQQQASTVFIAQPLSTPSVTQPTTTAVDDDEDDITQSQIAGDDDDDTSSA